jgi:spermidine synthase
MDTMAAQEPTAPQKPEWPPGAWFLDRGSPADLIAYEKKQVIVQGRTKFQEYEIFLSSLYGHVLVLDGRLQSAEKDEAIYHEAMVHPAMLAHPEPRQVLVLGGGEGATLREALRHAPVSRAVMVDIDEELVRLCEKWLPSYHAEAFQDPRTELVFADGRAWLEAQPDRGFDVILVDLPEPLEEGPALTLFTKEMYELVQRKLAPRGVMAVQSGSAGIHGRMMPDINWTLRAVFPQVMAYAAFIPSFMDLYGFHVAGGPEFVWPSPAEIGARLKSRGLDRFQWFGAAFSASLPLLPAYLAERLRRDGRVLTDAEPFGPRPGERLFF